MPTIDEGVVIRRPVEDVWATDFFNAPRMSGSGIIGLRQTSQGPTGVGSTLQGRRVVLGFETKNTFEVTQWDPPHAFAATTEGSPFRFQVTRVTLEPVEDGTRLHMVSDFELRLAMKAVWLVMAPVIRRRMHAGFARSKALIEAQPR